MKKHLLSLLLLAALMLTLFTACDSKPKVLTQDDAQAAALKDAGLSAQEVEDVHTHLVTENGIPCYSVHITVGETTYSYLIAANGGEILSADVG